MSSYVTRKTPGDTVWFKHDRFGMFIHWGLYAMPARHEWVKYQETMLDEKYDKYFKYFKYGSKYTNITYTMMEKAIKEVYHDMPQLLDETLDWFRKNWRK